MTMYHVTLSLTSRNSMVGLRILHTAMSARVIVRAASEECLRQGTTLEAVAGIEWIEDEDGNYRPARTMTDAEELAAAAVKLGDDGRLFKIEEGHISYNAIDKGE